MANSLEDIFKEDMKTIINAVEKNINGIRTVTFNTVKGDMSRRIFNNGIATDGSRIGNYAPMTKKIRNELGRRIDTVDLNITGTLQKSLVVGTEGGKVVVGMLEQNEPKTKGTRKEGKLKRGEGGGLNVKKVSISSGTLLTTDNAINQEKHFGKEIFAPSEQELKKGDEIFADELNKVIGKALGNKRINIKK